MITATAVINGKAVDGHILSECYTGKPFENVELRVDIGIVGSVWIQITPVDLERLLNNYSKATSKS